MPLLIKFWGDINVREHLWGCGRWGGGGGRVFDNHLKLISIWLYRNFHIGVFILYSYCTHWKY